MDSSTPDFPVHHQLLELAQTHVHWVGDAIQPSHPLSSPSHPVFNLSQCQGLFQWVSSLHQLAKILELQLQYECILTAWMNIQDCFHLGLTGSIPLQSKFKGLLRVFSNTVEHSSKSSIVWHSAFFMVQLSHSCMTPGKTIALTKQTFVGKATSLPFNVLSRLVIAFSPRCKRLLISWLQAPSAVILEPRNIVYHCFHCFSTYLPSNDGTGCHDFHFLNAEFLARFHSPLSLSSRSSLVPLCFLP